MSKIRKGKLKRLAKKAQEAKRDFDWSRSQEGVQAAADWFPFDRMVVIEDCREFYMARHSDLLDYVYGEERPKP